MYINVYINEREEERMGELQAASEAFICVIVASARNFHFTIKCKSDKHEG